MTARGVRRTRLSLRVVRELEQLAHSEGLASVERVFAEVAAPLRSEIYLRQLGFVAAQPGGRVPSSDIDELDDLIIAGPRYFQNAAGVSLMRLHAGWLSGLQLDRLSEIARMHRLELQASAVEDDYSPGVTLAIDFKGK